MAQIKKTITVSLPVYLDWHCSKCGAENHNVQNVQASVTTGNLWDKETPTNAALENLGGILESLTSPIPEKRFVDAKFSCKCRKCGHREPWASLNTDNLMAFNAALYCLAFFSFIGMMAEDKWCIVPLVLFAVAAVTLSIYIPLHKKKAIRLLNALSDESMPTVTIDNNGTVRHIAPPSELSNNAWVCCQCGIVNEASDRLCRRCETARAWSDQQEKCIRLSPSANRPSEHPVESATVSHERKPIPVYNEMPQATQYTPANTIPVNTTKPKEPEQQFRDTTTRWVCPKCGLVHSKELPVCFHCGTPQTSANKFIQ